MHDYSEVHPIVFNMVSSPIKSKSQSSDAAVLVCLPLCLMEVSLGHLFPCPTAAMGELGLHQLNHWCEDMLTWEMDQARGQDLAGTIATNPAHFLGLSHPHPVITPFCTPLSVQPPHHLPPIPAQAFLLRWISMGLPVHGKPLQPSHQWPRCGYWQRLFCTARKQPLPVQC